MESFFQEWRYIDNSPFHPSIHYHHHHHPFWNRNWKPRKQAWCIFSSAPGSWLRSSHLVSATGDMPAPPTCHLSLIFISSLLSHVTKSWLLDTFGFLKRTNGWSLGWSEVKSNHLIDVKINWNPHLYTPLFTAINKSNIVSAPAKTVKEPVSINKSGTHADISRGGP